MTNSRIHNPNEETYARACTLLQKGELVSFPTETVYGLGADATNSQAVAKIFAAKNRPEFNPLIVHVADTETVDKYVQMNDIAHALADAFWPGPFTMVLPEKDNSDLSDLISAGLNTVAIRVPEHPIAQELLTRFAGPVAAPSANISGCISPTKAAHVNTEFGEELNFIIDGGACKKGIESTIVMVSNNKIILLRPGNITTSEIEAVTGKKVSYSKKSDVLLAPGQLESHYAPKAKMRLNVLEPSKQEGLLAFGQTINHPGLNLSQSGDLTEAAANLFSMMREMDASGYSTIAVSPIPQTGLGVAINDRLKRAAAPKD